VLNLRDRDRSIALSAPANMYLLTSPSASLQSRRVLLNGTNLALESEYRLPSLVPQQRPQGVISLPAYSISFLAVPQAGTPSCT